jgi:hypothetical protein
MSCHRSTDSKKPTLEQVMPNPFSYCEINQFN